jgi:hypothetical protein
VIWGYHRAESGLTARIGDKPGEGRLDRRIRGLGLVLLLCFIASSCS